MKATYGIEGNRSIEGSDIQPRWGWGRGGTTTQDGAPLVLGFGIEPLRGSGARPSLELRSLYNTYEAPRCQELKLPLAQHSVVLCGWATSGNKHDR